MNRFTTKEFWLEKDKQFHFAASYLATVLFCYLGVLVGIPASYSASVSSNIVLFLGWIKEVNDGRGYGTKEIHDMDADILGVLAANVSIFIYIGAKYALQ